MAETQDRIEASLLRGIAQGEEDALSRLYDAAAPLLYATIVRVLGQSHDADDCLQDVFVRIWERAGQYDPRLGSPVAWLVVLARNMAVEKRRSRKRATDRLNNPLATPQLNRASPDPVQHTLLNDSLSRVNEGLKRLAPEQRQAISLAFFGGLTHREVAAALNQRVGTVKARIRRGLLVLRTYLEPST